MGSIEKILVERCKEVAKELILGAGEFYPFAYVFMNGECRGVQTSIDDNYPSANQEITAIKSTLYQLFKDHNFNAVAICINVNMNSNNGKIVDALEIRIDSNESKCQNIYVPYIFSGNNLTYESTDIITPGSFSFFRFPKFVEDESATVFTLKSILSGKIPILQVLHGSNGYWQFLGGTSLIEVEKYLTEQEIEISSFKSLWELDHSLEAIFDLLPGSEAFRENEQDIWRLEIKS